MGAVPVDGFWSISLYDAKGYFEPNTYDAYTLNNLTAQKDANGLVTIQFGAATARFRTAPDHAGLELYGAALSPPHRNPERQMEIS